MWVLVWHWRVWFFSCLWKRFWPKDLLQSKTKYGLSCGIFNLFDGADFKSLVISLIMDENRDKTSVKRENVLFIFCVRIRRYSNKKLSFINLVYIRLFLFVIVLFTDVTSFIIRLFSTIALNSNRLEFQHNWNRYVPYLSFSHTPCAIEYQVIDYSVIVIDSSLFVYLVRHSLPTRRSLANDSELL